MSPLAPVLQGFFTDKLIRQRQASPNTITAYRDTCRLLLAFASEQARKQPCQLDIADLDAETVTAFLQHLETRRANTVTTRNARLAAIRSLFRYAALHAPEHAAQISRVLAIPPKRSDRAGGEAGQGSGQPARTPAPGRCAPVSRMAATSTARKIRNSRSSTSSSIQAITPPRLFPRLLMPPAKQRRGHLSGSPCSIARGGTVASGTRSPRQRDGGVRGRGEQLPARRLGRHPPTVLPLPVGQRVSGHHHLAERDGAVAGDRHQRGRFHLDD